MSKAVQLDAGAKITFANDVSIESTTSLWLKLLVKGSMLNGFATTGVDLGIDYVGTSDFSGVKAGLMWLAGPDRFAIFAKDFGTYTLNTKTGALDVGGFDSSAYYWLRWLVDDGFGFSVTAHVSVFDEADPTLSSELAAWYTTSDIPVGAGGVDMSTGSGRGVRIINAPFGGLATAEIVVDQTQLGVDNTYATADVQLEEGSGTSVSSSGTISGSYTWINRSGGGVPGGALVHHLRTMGAY